MRSLNLASTRAQAVCSHHSYSSLALQTRLRPAALVLQLPSRRSGTRTRMSSSSSTSLAKPADTLKGAKILGREELKDPKWVHLEGIRWKTPDGREVSRRGRNSPEFRRVLGRRSLNDPTRPAAVSPHRRNVRRAAIRVHIYPKSQKRLLTSLPPLDGYHQVWECASRKTRGKAGVDAVAMLALISHPSSASQQINALQKWSANCPGTDRLTSA